MSEAEDLVVETFVRVWEAMEKGNGPTSNERAWLERTLRNTWRNKVIFDNALKRGGANFTLEPEDIQDFEMLIEKLKDGTRPVCAFIWNQILYNGGKLVAEARLAAKNRLWALVKALNAVIKGRHLCEAFYLGKLPKGDLSEEALSDLAESFPKPINWDVKRINRWLLHELFADHIKATPPRTQTYPINEPGEEGPPLIIVEDAPSPSEALERSEEPDARWPIAVEYLDDLKSCIRHLRRRQQEAFVLKHLALSPDTKKPFTQAEVARLLGETVGKVNNLVQDAFEAVRSCMRSKGRDVWCMLDAKSEWWQVVCGWTRERGWPRESGSESGT